MIISRTPFRISFFGGGSDYPQWYREHGGQVLATTINKYCYITARYLPPFFEHRYRVAYSEIENVQNVNDIQHPAVRETLKYLGITRGVEIHYDGDLPARSGMGSSSAFTVGLLHALYALEGAMVGPEKLTDQSQWIEQKVLEEVVGDQDQMLAAFGGLNHLTFSRYSQGVSPIILPRERLQELQSHLMLFYTGVQRRASDIAGTYVRDANFQSTMDMVDEGLALLNGGHLERFGLLLDEAWKIKRSLSPLVSGFHIDGLYRTAKLAGALGGKVLGAGGGGFVLLFVPPERQANVIAALPGLLRVPFKFESQGSQIIFYDQEEDHAAADFARQETTNGYSITSAHASMVVEHLSAKTY